MCNPSACGASLCLQKPQIRCTFQGYISAGLVSAVALKKAHSVSKVIISTALKHYHSILEKTTHLSFPNVSGVSYLVVLFPVLLFSCKCCFVIEIHTVTSVQLERWQDFLVSLQGWLIAQ